MKLTSLLDQDLVFCNLHASDREELYALMLQKAVATLDCLKLDVEKTTAGLIEREDAISLPYEGIAYPHVRLPELDDLYIIIGVLDEPMQIKAADPKPSQVVVLSLISPEGSATYLRMLSGFTRFQTNHANLHQLMQSRSGADFLKVLNDANVMVKRNITAEDMMTRDCPRVTLTDKLAVALDIFNSNGSEVLPVVNAAGKLVGILDSSEIVRRFIPDYIFMLDNLKFLTSFEVFDRIFQEENHLAVKDYMQPAATTISPDTPLIQFTVGLARHEAWTYYVVDEENILLGEISIHNIIHKVLRG